MCLSYYSWVFCCLQPNITLPDPLPSIHQNINGDDSWALAYRCVAMIFYTPLMGIILHSCWRLFPHVFSEPHNFGRIAYARSDQCSAPDHNQRTPASFLWFQPCVFSRTSLITAKKGQQRTLNSPKLAWILLNSTKMKQIASKFWKCLVPRSTWELSSVHCLPESPSPCSYPLPSYLEPLHLLFLRLLFFQMNPVSSLFVLTLWNAQAIPLLKHFPQGCLPITTTSLVRSLPWLLSSYLHVDALLAAVRASRPEHHRLSFRDFVQFSRIPPEAHKLSGAVNHCLSAHIYSLTTPFLSTLIPLFQLLSTLPSGWQVLNTGDLFLTIFWKIKGCSKLL